MSTFSLQVTDDATQQPVRARTWLRWVVAGLLFLTIWVGLLLWRMNSADSLQVAVEQAGGWYGTLEQPYGFKRHPMAEFLLGQPSRSIMVRFVGNQVNDDWLMKNRDLLERAQNLRLVLHKSPVTDEGVLSLRFNVDCTDLYGTQVTDALLKNADFTKNLVTLNIARTNVTDEGLKNIQFKFPTNGLLGVDGTQLTDIGVQHLQNCGEIQDLLVYGVDDTVLQRIQTLSMSVLTIYQDDPSTSCTFEAVKALLEKKRIAYLRLVGTNFTDDEIRSLKQIRLDCRLHQSTVDEHESSYPWNKKQE